MLQGVMKMLMVVVFALGLMSPFSFVEAQSAPPQCDCFCKTSEGVLSSGGVAGQEACKTICKESSDPTFRVQYLGCFTEDQKDSLPKNNRLCWSQASCLNDLKPVEDEEEPQSSVWGGQENFCLPGEGYCYNPPGYIADFGCPESNPACASTKVTLGVPIGDLEKASNLGEYIEAVYDFLIGAGALIAIVMIMVAGVEWMTARGREAGITKAKQRISSALLGLGLLLFTVTIATLIDPNTVSFKNLGVPKIRQLNYDTDIDRCEYLKEIKVIVDPNLSDKAINCGTVGTVTDVTQVEGGAESIAGLEEGGTCHYNTCGDNLSCLKVGEDDYTCSRCANIYRGAGNAGITPSASTCAGALDVVRARELRGERGSSDGTHLYCGYDPDAIRNVITSGAYGADYAGVARASCSEIIYPFNSSIATYNPTSTNFNAYDFGDFSKMKGVDCKQMRKDLDNLIADGNITPETAYNACSMYNRAYVVSGLAVSNTAIVGGSSVAFIASPLNDFRVGESERLGMLNNVCLNDPCNLGEDYGEKLGCGVTLQDVSFTLVGINITSLWGSVSALPTPLALVPGSIISDTEKRYYCGSKNSAQVNNSCSRCTDCFTGFGDTCGESECNGLGTCKYTDRTWPQANTCEPDPASCN